MILLQVEDKAVAVFGAGLIGAGIVDAVCRGRRAKVTEIPFHWSDATRRGGELAQAESAIRTVVTAGNALDVVWSAGRAGFMSTDDETGAELRSFSDVLAMSQRFPAHVRFHLISSAGALFEGQRHVTGASVVAPRRAYGTLKLRQEEMLQAAGIRHRIYRVSSVYGYIRDRFRLGLVAMLIRNGIRQTSTRITGRMTTLRDFVFIDDVSSFIADRILEPEASDASVLLLASARPYSLLEVEHSVEQVLGRKLQVSYSAEENAEDITFSPTVMPAGWFPSDLRGNVGMIYRDALSSGTFGEAA